MYSFNVRVAPQGINSNSLESLNGAQRASMLELDCAGVTTETRILSMENCLNWAGSMEYSWTQAVTHGWRVAVVGVWP